MLIGLECSAHQTAGMSPNTPSKTVKLPQLAGKAASKAAASIKQLLPLTRLNKQLNKCLAVYLVIATSRLAHTQEAFDDRESKY